MAHTHSDYDLVFRSAALAPEDLFLNRLDGREALSELYEFRLVLESRYDQGLGFSDIDEMLAKRAYVAFGPNEEHKIHGAIRSVEMLPSSRPATVNYEIHLVPRLWYATQTAGCWVYLGMSVPEMIRDVLNTNGLSEGRDYELRLTDSYVKREYTLQYQETDFDFIARLMEHEGMFFYWEHGEEREVLVIGDANVAFQELSGHESIAFDPGGNTTDLREVMVGASRRRSTIPSHLVVKDYNYRTPMLPLRTGLVVDDAGRGTQVRYGDHFKDLAAAKRIAKLRAEEIYARREVYGFTGRVRGLRAGHRFTLVDHFVDSMRQEYVVTSVQHHAAQFGGGGASGDNAGYSNQSTAIPNSVAFRPQLKTSKPKIHGFTQAKIDGAPTADGTTPIDPDGRYKVSSICDNTKTETFQASRWVRRAQPYSGSGYGMHFPLHVGSEVMLLHVDGDPDRPVIVGTPPNPDHGTPVGEIDSQRSRIITRSGMIMGWHDYRVGGAVAMRAEEAPEGPDSFSYSGDGGGGGGDSGASETGNDGSGQSGNDGHAGGAKAHGRGAGARGGKPGSKGGAGNRGSRASGSGASGSGASGSGASGNDATGSGAGGGGTGASGSGAGGSGASGSGMQGHGASGGGARGHGASGSDASGSGVTGSGVTGSGVTGSGAGRSGVLGSGTSGGGASGGGLSGHGAGGHGAGGHGAGGSGATGSGGLGGSGGGGSGNTGASGSGDSGFAPFDSPYDLPESARDERWQNRWMFQSGSSGQGGAGGSTSGTVGNNPPQDSQVQRTEHERDDRPAGPLPRPLSPRLRRPGDPEDDDETGNDDSGEPGTGRGGNQG